MNWKRFFSFALLLGLQAHAFSKSQNSLSWSLPDSSRYLTGYGFLLGGQLVVGAGFDWNPVHLQTVFGIPKDRSSFFAINAGIPTVVIRQNRWFFKNLLGAGVANFSAASSSTLTLGPVWRFQLGHEWRGFEVLFEYTVLTNLLSDQVSGIQHLALGGVRFAL